jgi:hypothetical protein
MAVVFYCLGTLDVTGLAEQKISPTDRSSWKEWIWDQYVGEKSAPFFSLRGVVLTLFFLGSPLVSSEGGFLPGPFVSGGDSAAQVRFLPILHPPRAQDDASY